MNDRPTPQATGLAEANTPPQFRRLLAQRRLFGRLAETYRSHHGATANTDALDAVVELLTEELETRFPDLWQPLEGELLVTELGLFHDPTEGPAAGCSLCEQAARPAPFPPQPHRTWTSRPPSRRVAVGQEAA